MKKTLSVLIFKQQQHWCAQALEHDIHACGNDFEDLMDCFLITLEQELIQEGGLKRIDPAPEKFFDLWNSCDEKIQSSKQKSKQKNRLNSRYQTPDAFSNFLKRSYKQHQSGLNHFDVRLAA